MGRGKGICEEMNQCGLQYTVHGSSASNLSVELSLSQTSKTLCL
jgi:hypothetical protein